jgi:hypothetical protein
MTQARTLADFVAGTAAITGNPTFSGTVIGAGKDWTESAAIGTLDSAAHTVTGIPSGTREIMMTWNDVGHSGSSGVSPRIQLGTSGGIVTSGYIGFYEYVYSGSTHASTSQSVGLADFGNWGASTDWDGYCYAFCSDLSGHVWFSQSAMQINTSYDGVYRNYSRVDLSAEVDRISMNVQSGTFNTGTARVFYK